MRLFLISPEDKHQAKNAGEKRFFTIIALSNPFGAGVEDG